MKELNAMTIKELKDHADTNNIDVKDCKKKAEILNRILENEKEDVKMTDVNENVVVGEDKNEEVVVEADKDVYTLDDGTECSRSAYIRQEFAKDHSRKEIAEALGVKYYIVYAATANMYNAVHQETGTTATRGRASVLVPAVNEKFEFIDAEGNVVESEDLAARVARADLMKELARVGVSRKDMQKHFDVSYATVYAATKEVFEELGLATTSTKAVITHPETGEEVNRADYIRELFADGEGLSRREIAEKLTAMTGKLVDYAAVWSATKANKDKEEKTAEEAVEESTENATEAVENPADVESAQE